MELRWYASKSLDTLGHHCVTCRCGGDVTTRHNALRNVLHNAFHRASLSAHLEQGSSYKSRSRPADILVANWDRGLSALLSRRMGLGVQR